MVPWVTIAGSLQYQHRFEAGAVGTTPIAAAVMTEPSATPATTRP
jgi:hypothetical protein